MLVAIFACSRLVLHSRHADTERHFFIPGWEMPYTWPPAASGGAYGGLGGVPDDGHYRLEYSSDEVCFLVFF